MIIDTSAIIAIFYNEPDAAGYAEAIARMPVRRISVGNWLEVTMVLSRVGSMDAVNAAERWFERQNIVIEPITLEQGHIARKAFLDFGKGRHPAGLNSGDCFAYALAKDTGEALLFKGQDFSQTDVGIQNVPNVEPPFDRGKPREPFKPMKVYRYDDKDGE